mgnify:CR=1 FL=1|jgi:hypothetical protein
MGNIILDFPNTKQESSYGEADFEIASSPLMYKDAEGNSKVSSKHSIYRTDTGEELGVHGKNYSAPSQLSYKRMIDNQRSIFEKADLNTTDMKENIAVSGNGKRCFVTNVLPEETLITPDGDRASLSFLSATSLDGTLPFIMSAGAEQGACLNGQVFISGAATLYKSRHNRLLDIDRGAKLILDVTTTFQAEVDRWHEWSNTSITRDDARREIATLSNCPDVLDFGRLPRHPPYVSLKALRDNSKKINKAGRYLLVKWEEYSTRMGMNRWALYNTFTDWSTHAPTRSTSNVSNVTYLRGERVKKHIITNFETPSVAA